MSTPSRRRGKPLRFRPIPLSFAPPDWLDLDRQIPADHLARRLRLLVDSLDLSDLLETYTGVGGPILPPDLLLAFVLLEMHQQRLSPAQWFLDSRESLPVRWLLQGFRPCRARLYRFRRHHLPEALLKDLNRQVLLLAVAEGHTTAARACLDGTFTAARPDKGRTIKRRQGQERLDELAQRMGTAEAKGKYKRRSQTVELRQADLKSHRGLWRFGGYGREQGESQVGMLVLADNGLGLLEAREKGKRAAQPPPASPGIPPLPDSAK